MKTREVIVRDDDGEQLFISINTKNRKVVISGKGSLDEDQVAELVSYIQDTRYYAFHHQAYMSVDQVL